MIQDVFNQALQMIDEQQQSDRYFFNQKISKLKQLDSQYQYINQKNYNQQTSNFQNDFQTYLLGLYENSPQTFEGKSIIQASYILVQKILSLMPQARLRQVLPLIEQHQDQIKQDYQTGDIQNKHQKPANSKSLQNIQKLRRHQQFNQQQEYDSGSRSSQTKSNRRSVQEVEAQYEKIINELIKSHQQSTQMAQQQFRKLIQQKLSEFQIANQSIRRTNSQLQSKLQRLDLQRFEAVQQLFEIRTQFKGIQQKYAVQIKNLKDFYENQISQLELKLKKQGQQIQQFTALKQQQQEQKMSELKRRKDQEIQEIKKQMYESIEKLTNQLNSRNYQCAQLQQSFKKQFERIQRQVQIKDGEKTELKAQVRQREMKIESYQTKISQFRSEIEYHQSKTTMILQEVNNKQQFINHLKFQLQNRNDEINNLNGIKQQLERQIQVLEGTNQTLRVQIVGYLARQSKQRQMYQQIIKLKVALRNHQNIDKNYQPKQLNQKIIKKANTNQEISQHRVKRANNLRNNFQQKLNNIKSKIKIPITHKNTFQIGEQTYQDRYIQYDRIKEQYTPKKSVIFCSKQQQQWQPEKKLKLVSENSEDSIINSSQNFISQILDKKGKNTPIKIQEWQGSQKANQQVNFANNFTINKRLNFDKELQEQIDKQLQQLRKKRNKYRQGIFNPLQYSHQRQKQKSKLNRWKSSQNLGKQLRENQGKIWQKAEKQQNIYSVEQRQKQHVKLKYTQQRHLTPTKINQNNAYDIYPSSSGKKQFSILDKFNSKNIDQKFRFNSSQQSID